MNTDEHPECTDHRANGPGGKFPVLDLLAPGDLVGWGDPPSQSEGLCDLCGIVIATELNREFPEHSELSIYTVLWNRPAPWALIFRFSDGAWVDGQKHRQLGRWRRWDLGRLTR